MAATTRPVIAAGKLLRESCATTSQFQFFIDKTFEKQLFDWCGVSPCLPGESISFQDWKTKCTTSSSQDIHPAVYITQAALVNDMNIEKSKSIHPLTCWWNRFAFSKLQCTGLFHPTNTKDITRQGNVGAIVMFLGETIISEEIKILPSIELFTTLPKMLHDCGVFHTDIRPPNILQFTQMPTFAVRRNSKLRSIYRLIDFDLAVICEDSSKEEITISLEGQPGDRRRCLLSTIAKRESLVTELEENSLLSHYGNNITCWNATLESRMIAAAIQQINDRAKYFNKVLAAGKVLLAPTSLTFEEETTREPAAKKRKLQETVEVVPVETLHGDISVEF